METKEINLLTKSVQPEHEEMILNVLKKTMPKVRSIAAEIQNSILTFEDAIQEMQIEQIKVIRKIQEIKSFDDLVCICLRSLELFKRYSFRNNLRIKDRASVSVDISESHEFLLIESEDSSENRTNDFLSRVRDRVEQAEIKYPGIKLFFEESIEPSLDTLKKLSEYKDKMVNPRGLTNNENVPTKILGSILGFTPRRIITFKSYLSQIMVDSGISQKRVAFYFPTINDIRPVMSNSIN